MSKRVSPLSREEIAAAFGGDWGQRFGPVLAPADFARLIGLSRATVYEWIARGRLAGAVRRRGKHSLIWRDRALEILFNGADWNDGRS